MHRLHDSLVDGLLAATTLSLRGISVLFVRFYPIAKFLPRVYLSSAAFAILALCRTWLLRSRERKRRRHPIPVVLLGWVHSSQPLASALAAFINLLFLLAAVDFVYRGYYVHPSNDLSFSRLGFVDVTTAHVVFRSADACSSVIEVKLRQDSNDAQWRVAGTATLSRSHDCVGTVRLDGLSPDTAYVYTTNASLGGTFKTAQAHPKKWSMVQTSCMNPFYPYNPADHALRIKGLEYLSRYISNRTVDFMLFLGDFIYIDLPYPIGFTKEHYTTAYRQTYASPSWTDSLRSLPWLHVYDDHEIINDWSSNETGLYSDAIAPYWHYQGGANPPSRFGQGVSYYTFERGDIAFFVLDTRRYRSESHLPDGPDKTMLGATQLADLRRWLVEEKKWKCVVSSVPFTRNWRSADSMDRWAGYMWERRLIMSWMSATDGVLLLSGDRHEHATTVFPPAGGTGKSLIEFSTSALNQFYEPFDRSHRQIEDTDVAIHSHYEGNSKFASFSFDTSDAKRWLIHFDLLIDGEKTWEYDWTYER